MKKYFIYLYSFPNGKVYVGQSQLGVRRYGFSSRYKNQVVYRAMIKYPDYEKTILVYCDESEVDELERYYIEKYDSTNPEKGYNKDSGGHLNKHMSEDTIKKMSESAKERNSNFKGKHHSEETKRKMLEKAHTIPIYCEELNKEFASSKEAARQLGLDQGNISKCCKGKLKTTGGYHFHYKEAI